MQLSGTGQEKMNEFNAKIRVLIAYGYMDIDMNLLFKGKVALELVSTDKIITTELIFSGLLKALTLEEIIALFSVLYPQIKAPRTGEPCSSTISEGFNNAL